METFTVPPPGAGSGGGGVVYRVTPSRNYKVLHSFPVGTQIDGNDPIAGLVFATDGKFYGSTFARGLNGYGVAFNILATGQYSILNNFDKLSGSSPSSDMVQHTNGWIYGLALGGTHIEGFSTVWRLILALRSSWYFLRGRWEAPPKS